MTKQEFNEYLENYLKKNNKSVDDLTDEDLVEIGKTYKELPTCEKSWDELVSVLHVDKPGERFRVWLKGRQYKDGSIKKNVQLLSGQTIDDLSFPEAEEKLNQIKNDLYIQQTKTRDQRNSLRRSLRDEARIQDMKDLVKDSIKTLPDLKFTDYIYPEDAHKEAVLLLSDLHIGAVVDNFYNKYNVDVAVRRVNKLIDEVITACKDNKVQRLNVCNLGDIVHGGIHLSARVENNEDRVDEIMTASEIIANALVKLSSSIPEVVYRSTIGNHDRMTPNLHEAIEKENFIRIIDWYLEARLKDSKVIFADDNLDESIGLFELENGKLFAFAHGHQDRNDQQSLLALSSILDRRLDYFAIGHFHSAGLKTNQGTMVINNGSVMGVDSYASSIRAYGPATQTLVLFDDSDNVINMTINLQKA